MTSDKKTKSLGQAVDEIIGALDGLDAKDQQIAIQVACARFSLKEITTPTAAPTNSSQTPLPSSMAASPPIDICSLKERKSPSSAREMACIVAYYLQNLAPENERKEAIAKADLDKYFKQAGYPLPKAMDQLLKDAKGAGYFDSAAHGSYKLNPVGYNLVVHGLPRGSKTQAK